MSFGRKNGLMWRQQHTRYLVLIVLLPSSLLLRFPAFLGGEFCYSVISYRRYTLPALLASLKYAYSPCVLSSCVADDDLSLFYSSLPSLFRFRFGHRLFSSSFSCAYYAVSSVSVSAATRLAYDMYLDTYVRWYHLFYFCLMYTICFSFSVYYLLFIFVFTEVIFRARCWSPSCDHGLHCSDELMWEQQYRSGIYLPCMADLDDEL